VQRGHVMVIILNKGKRRKRGGGWFVQTRNARTGKGWAGLLTCVWHLSQTTEGDKAKKASKIKATRTGKEVNRDKPPHARAARKVREEKLNTSRGTARVDVGEGKRVETTGGMIITVHRGSTTHEGGQIV